jgi:hypothetical protein
MLALSQRFGVMTRVTELESMAASAKDGIPQMISIKAVDPELFPFYGDLKVSPPQPLASITEGRFVGCGDTRVPDASAGGSGRHDSLRRARSTESPVRLITEPDRSGVGLSARYAGSDEPRGFGAQRSDSIRQPRGRTFLVQAEARRELG